MRDHFVEQLGRLAHQDPRIFLITGDLGFGVLDDFAKKFPQQFLNVGVAEQNMTGIATGLALEGRTVFTYSIANFPTLRCLEQLRNDACYHEANVNVVSIGGGFSYGALGFSHYATEDLAILRSLPNITVAAPCDDWEAMEATTALAKTAGVGYLRLDKSSAGHTGRPDERFELGKARVLREGADLTIMSCGGILGVALEVAERLATEGIHCRVVSCHTIKPLDVLAVRMAVQQTGGIVTLEEHTIDGGFGSAVAEVCLDNGWIPSCFHRFGIRQRASVVGSQDYMRMLHGLDAESVHERIVAIVRGRTAATLPEAVPA